MHLRQTVREHRHPPPVGLPLRHVGEGDREVHQAGSGDQRAQKRAGPVPHPESHHKGDVINTIIMHFIYIVLFLMLSHFTQHQYEDLFGF